MPENYNIYFSGEIAAGEALSDVRDRVGALFNARDNTLDKLFSGKTQLIKRNCSIDEARKYQAAMRRAGALATIAPAEPGDERRTAGPRSPASDVSTAATAPGADNEPQVPAVAAGTDFSLAPAGERLSTPPPAPPPPPDTSHLSVMAIGDAIPTLRSAPPPPPPDTSGLRLEDPGNEPRNAPTPGWQRARDPMAGDVDPEAKP